MLRMLLFLTGCLVNAPLYAERSHQLKCDELAEAWTTEQSEEARQEALDAGCTNDPAVRYADCDRDQLGDGSQVAWVSIFERPDHCPEGVWSPIPGDCDDADQGAGISWEEGLCGDDVVAYHSGSVLVLTPTTAAGARAGCAWLGRSLMAVASPGAILDRLSDERRRVDLSEDSWAGKSIWVEADVASIAPEDWCEEPDVDGLLEPLLGDLDAYQEARAGLTPAYRHDSGCLDLPADFVADAYLCGGPQ